MKHVSLLVVAFALFAAGCGSTSTTAPSLSPLPNQPIFKATLSPASEVPPVTNAEASGSGTATITFFTTTDSAGNVTAATVTFVVDLTGFPPGTPINVANIHEGPPTCACPVVVNTTLTSGQVVLTNGSGSFTRGGITVDPALAQRIINSPASFYFNAHSTLNPGGAARGILVRVQ